MSYRLTDVTDLPHSPSSLLTLVHPLRASSRAHESVYGAIETLTIDESLKTLREMTGGSNRWKGAFVDLVELNQIEFRKCYALPKT